MPDWKRIVSENMSALNLPPGATEEVIAELAIHMEETYESVRAHGLSNSAAMEQTLQEVGNWRVLAEDIHRAKSEEVLMNHRTKSLWLPTLFTLLGASVSLMAAQLLGLQPRLVWIHGMGITLYWPWLAGLPLCGALGANLSQRAHGPVRARLAAGLSPALLMLIVMLLILPWGLAIDGVHFFILVGFGLAVANWVALPAVALLLGAAPFLRESPEAGTLRSTT
ncbi:MAG: hypothetical protein ACLPHP_07545 [Candidatus Sulfotelmatobacter sp.]